MSRGSGARVNEFQFKAGNTFAVCVVQRVRGVLCKVTSPDGRTYKQLLERRRG